MKLSTGVVLIAVLYGAMGVITQETDSNGVERAEILAQETRQFCHQILHGEGAPSAPQGSELAKLLAPQGPGGTSDVISPGSRCDKAQRAHSLICDLHGLKSRQCKETLSTVKSSCKAKTKDSIQSPTLRKEHDANLEEGEQEEEEEEEAPKNGSHRAKPDEDGNPKQKAGIQDEDDFFTSAGLPSPKAFQEVVSDLGESMGNEHAEEIHRRIRALQYKGHRVAKLVNALPTSFEVWDEDSSGYRSLHRSIRHFRRAARHLQPDAIQELVESSTLGEISSVGDSSESGSRKSVKEIEASLRRRSSWPSYHEKRAKANIKCGGCLSKQETKKAVKKAEEKVEVVKAATEKVSSPWTVLKKYATPSTLLRKGKAFLSHVLKNFMKAITSMMGKLAGVLKLARSLSGTSFKPPDQKDASKSMAGLIGFIEKLRDRILNSLPAGVLQRLNYCATTMGNVMRNKCNYGKGDKPYYNRRENQFAVTRRCEPEAKGTVKGFGSDGGGGYGHNWLWGERMNFREHPTKWQEIVPDNSECLNKEGKPHKCPSEQYCVDKIKDYHDFGNQWDEEAKTYWRNFTVTHLKKKCEEVSKDGPQCVLAKLQYAGGMYRCVQRIDQATDARFSSKHTDHVGAKVTRKGYATWQRSVNPFGSGSQGFTLQYLPPPSDGETGSSAVGGGHYSGRATLSKAYITTSDICLRYRNEANERPPSRVRCLSQQFRWFADESSLLICMSWTPDQLGKLIIDSLIKPLLKLLPGNVERLFGPTLDDVSESLGRDVVAYVDHFLRKGPPVPILRPIWEKTIGRFYIEATDFLHEFFSGVNIRQILQKQGRGLLDADFGMVDYALDSSLARNRMVYYGAKCPDSEVSDCPEFHNIRSFQVTGIRFGDHYGSPFSSMWPRRVTVNVGRGKTEMAFIKQSLCAKLPVCDTQAITQDLDVYDSAGKNRDCSGHGECVWNRAKGNHCKCDAGYKSVAQDTQCCEAGQQTCADKSARDAPTEDEQVAVVTAASPLKNVSNVIKQIVKDEVQNEVERVFANRTSGDLLAIKGRKLLGEPDQQLGEGDFDGFTSRTAALPAYILLTQTVTKATKLALKGANREQCDKEKNMLPSKTCLWTPKYVGLASGVEGQTIVEGEHIVSQRCEGLSESGCKAKLGCQFTSTGNDRGYGTVPTPGAFVGKGVNNPRGLSGQRWPGSLRAAIKMATDGNLTIGKDFAFIQVLENRVYFYQANPSITWEEGAGWCGPRCWRIFPGSGVCRDATSWQCSTRKKVTDCTASAQFAPHDMGAGWDQVCGMVGLNQRTKETKYCDKGVRRGENCDKHTDCPNLPGSANSALNSAKCKMHHATAGCQSSVRVTCNDLGYARMAIMGV